MAAFAAAFTGSGTSKCGCPMLRLTGFFSDRARSNTLRTPDTSTAPHRSASHDSGDTEHLGQEELTTEAQRHGEDKRETVLQRTISSLPLYLLCVSVPLWLVLFFGQ